MQIVIDMPDTIYQRYLIDDWDLGDADVVRNRIKNGTPLPKGHGKIIDESKITNIYYHKEISKNEIFRHEYFVIDGTDAPTIIETDKEKK